jgi:membrane protease YdiL (CAAX protease family)
MNNAEPMRDEQPIPQSDASEPMQTAPAAMAPEPALRDPFWGYTDLALFIGLTVPSMLLGMAVVRAVMWICHIHPSGSLLELLPEQIVGYGLLFGALRLIFRIEYDQPFWPSIGWTPIKLAPAQIVLAGIGTAMAVVLAASLIHLPDAPNPMRDLLLQGRMSLVLMAAFGVGVAPLCEELAFRGFVQPLLVRSCGAFIGILIPSVAFGLLHFEEYGNSWRHALLLSGAGGAFGVMRHFTRSTKAAVLMHASYNGVLFLLLAISLANERIPHR